MTNSQKLGFIIVRIITVILLIWALDRHTYGYYVLLRFVVCGVCAYGAYLAAEIKKNGWVWILGGMAILFNPILPFHLGRDTWAIVDIVTAIILLLSLFLFKMPSKES